MTIYGEYLFAENFLAGYGILKVTGMLCGRRPARGRVLAGAGLCGIFSFIVLADMPRAAALPVEALFAVSLSIFVFRPGERSAAARIACVMLISSFVLGGAAVAFIYVSGVRCIVSNGVMYAGGPGAWQGCGYLAVFAGGLTGLLSMVSAAKYIRRKAPSGREILNITVELMGSRLRCTGRIDSANYLREPVSGSPVSLVRQDFILEKWRRNFESPDMDSRFRVVPFRSLGCESGVITAIRCDRMIIDRGDIFGRGRIFMENPYLGLYDGIFDSGDENYEILLQPDSVNGGTIL